MPDEVRKPATDEQGKTADTPAGASDSPRPDDRKADEGASQQDRHDWKAEALGLKARLEEINRREAERAASTASPTDARQPEGHSEMNQLRAAYADLMADANAGDPRAMLQLKLIEDQIRTRQELLIQQDLGRIHDPDRRSKVWDYFQKHGDEVKSIAAAELAVDGIEFREKRDKLAASQREAEAIIAARTTGAQGTHGSREVTATEKELSEMTDEQFDIRIQELRDGGKDAEARRLMGLVRQGKVRLKRTG